MRSIRHLTLAALTLAFGLSAALAQNCAQTSVGTSPINDLGTGTYQGFEGGLYPSGSNVRPELHTIHGFAQAAQVIPRDAAGAPDLNAGKIVFLSIGMSNCTQEFSRFVELANADALKSAHVVPVDGAQGGQTAQIISDPNAQFWTIVMQRLQQNSVTAQQVQAIWFKEANAMPSDPFPAHAITLQNQFVTIMQILHQKFPNARVCYFASRIYAGYATSTLNPEPKAYEQGFACKWTIEEQIGGSPALNFDPAHGTVMSPWIDWGTYNWADGLTPRSDGLIWQCQDFISDGTHPSTSGREKVAQFLLAFVHSDPTAASWYLAEPTPATYGHGKTTSIGTVPSAGWTGTPSFAGSGFAITFSNAIPNGIGLGFYGSAPDAVPFVNATRYVANPLSRLPVRAYDASGHVAYSIAIQPNMVGKTLFYQGYIRDVAQPDGTGAGVSNGLRVVYFD